jgi:hypothetical protein
MKESKRILKMLNPTGHPYWQAGEYNIIMPDGTKYPMCTHNKGFGHGYKIEVRPDGIYYVLHFCSSGSGKVPCTDGRYPPERIVSSSEYDEIEYVGNELLMSDELKHDLACCGF